MNLMHNIDPIRARIMELESATVFDQRAWAEVLIALTDRPNARADAARRMETAKENQLILMPVIELHVGCRELLLFPAPVSAETEMT